MVAANIRLPNIRRMFVPDPRFTIADADLSGADAQVVAWEAGDEDLKTAFKLGLKIHVHNARTMWPEYHKDMDNDEVKDSKYYKPVKVGCHACNYGASVNALISNCGWDRHQAMDFRGRWFEAHPAIHAWHERTDRHLKGFECWNCNDRDITFGKPCRLCGASLGRTVKNRFNFRRMFFDRMDGNILPQALAWTPQSTVAFSTEIGWTNIAYGHKYSLQMGHAKRVTYDWSKYLITPEAASKWHNVIRFLIQVHDSIVFELPHAYETDLGEIVEDMRVIVPYDEPLIIPMGFKFSRQSWGDCG